MITIFLRTIKDRWRMLLAVSVIGVGSMLMYVSMYPTYQKSLAQSQEIFKNMPEALMKAFNMDTLSFDTLEKFLNVEMYSMFWLILTILLTLSLAGNALAGDVERETSTITAAQPVARWKIYGGRFLAAALMVTVFNAFINLSVFPLAAAFNLTAHARNFLMVGLMGELFALALLGVTFAVSAFLSDKGKVYMTLGGVLLVMYVLNIVSALQASLDKLKFVSIFHYFNPGKFLVKGEFDLLATVVFVGLLVAGATIGLIRWRTRDIV